MNAFCGISTLPTWLQDSVTVEADVENLTAPQVMLACATNADALGTNERLVKKSLLSVLDLLVLKHLVILQEKMEM